MVIIGILSSLILTFTICTLISGQIKKEIENAEFLIVALAITELSIICMIFQ
jgi:hypothetical protein